MQPSRPFIETLEQRIRSSTCTPEELELFRKWMSALDIADVDTELSPELLNRLKARMHQQLMEEIQAAPVVSIASRRGLIRRYIRVAAAILLVVCSGILFWYTNSRSGAADARIAAALTVINNDKNVVRKVTMTDGTVIWLNRHSTLTFDQQQYNRTRRYVKLSGEGFFEVTSDTARPFVVETNNIQTRVLGTAFNIEAWQQESEIRVSLVHGKVALKNISTAAVTALTPDQTMRYSKQTGKWTIWPMAVNHIQDWTTGALVFNEVPLNEALQRIAMRFNLIMDYDEHLLLNKRITASFPGGNWQSALHNILFVHGLNYHTARGHVVITH